ncbi:MAG: HAD-IC family P-type ATPase [Bdellovibrionales bacterium]|nr:HAD-IC family P-type ATPase [Bdellovibrionales bacterium]
MTETKACCHHEPPPTRIVTPEDLTKEFTCPMHPEVRQIGPGSCPSCGMALEPADPFAEASGADPEFQSLKIRLFWSAALTAPLFLLAMGGHFTPHAAHWLQFLLAAPVVLFAGAKFHHLAWQSVMNASPNMFTLISIGTLAAFGYSTLALLAPGIFPGSLRNEHGLVGVYFEASAVIITLVIVGQILENAARKKTGDAVRELVKLKPDTAILFIDNDLDTEIPVDQIEEGQVLRVRPGTRVPVDGYIEFGSSFVDESMLTGESSPAAKGVGSKVMAGTMNKNGSFLMRAAQRSKAPIQRIADRVAEWFVPFVVAVAIAAGFAWFTWGPEPRLAHSLVAAVSVLIIACPCALGLATPMSITVALGRAARGGVLIRTAETLERIGKVSALVFDKTGTLTEGRPRVVSLLPIGNHSEDSLLTYAASVEAHSEHPLGLAIRNEARTRNLPLRECFAFESFTGGGVKGTVELEPVVLGNARFLREMGIDAQAAESTLQELEEKVEQRSRQLDAARAKLIHSDRLASLGQLAASVAHEVNNPIGSVINLTMLLRRIMGSGGIPPGREEEFRRHLQRIEEETTRVGRIVSDLLSFSRRSKPQRDPSDLNAIVGKTIELLHHKLDLAGVDARLDLDPALAPVPCDRSQIEQVLINLVMNAAEAVGRGGKVVVRTAREPGTALLEVRDNGPGIPADVLPRIYDPFFTTKDAGKGVGLGLAVVYGIVEAHGGSIDVASRAGEGATFTVRLPMNPNNGHPEVQR